MQYIVDIQPLNHHFEIIIRSFALTKKSTAKNKKINPPTPPHPKKNNKKPKNPNQKQNKSSLVLDTMHI